MKTSYLSPTAWLSEASRDGLGNRFWIDTRLLSVKVKCPDPGVASHDQKPDSGDSLRHQIPTPCPHSPPHGIYIDRCIIWKRIITVIDATFAVWKESLKKLQACTEFEPLTSAIPVLGFSSWANKPTGSRSLNLFRRPFATAKVASITAMIFFHKIIRTIYFKRC